MKILERDIYEITAKTNMQGVMLRGTIRKYCIEVLKINSLQENAQVDEKVNTVRFAVLHDEATETVDKIKAYIYSLILDAGIELVLERVQNPVLSKLKVNDASRYTK